MTKQQQPETAWRRYPQFEKVFDGGQLPGAMENIEKTCRRLDAIQREGAAEDKERARLAMAAYGRTLELINELNAARSGGGSGE